MSPLSPWRRPIHPHPLDKRRRAAWWGRALIAAAILLTIIFWN